MAGVLAFGLLGAVAREWYLGRQASERRRLMLEELPGLVDLVCLAVTAGASPVAALGRAAAASGGPLGQELRWALAEVQTGQGLGRALGAFSRRVPLPAAVRFAEALRLAMERGTPVAEVLRAQAEDAREAWRRYLLETAGKREVAMLVPVVFLILPATLLFALWPGFVALTSLAR
jgi:tight adherence protein C